MAAKHFWIGTFILGLVVTVLGLITISQFPSDGHDVPVGYGGPVFMFENVKTQSDLVAVFGPENDPQRAERIAAMDLGNYWDFPFMASYALFMAFFCLAAWRTDEHIVWLVFSGVGILSGFADAVENLILLGITADIASAPNMGWLAIPVWTKFLSISAAICASGWFILSRPALTFKVLGLIAILGGSVNILAFMDPSEFGWLIRHGTTAGWLIMLGYSGYRVIISVFRSTAD